MKTCDGVTHVASLATYFHIHARAHVICPSLVHPLPAITRPVRGRMLFAPTSGHAPGARAHVIHPYETMHPVRGRM